MGTTSYAAIGIVSWQFPLVPGKKLANLAGLSGNSFFFRLSHQDLPGSVALVNMEV